MATFSYTGEGLAEEMTVAVYDFSGHLVWEATEESSLGITWDGRDERGRALANGRPYIYIIVVRGSGKTFTGKGTVFIDR